jgi:hypothetical protein
MKSALDAPDLRLSFPTSTVIFAGGLNNGEICQLNDETCATVQMAWTASANMLRQQVETHTADVEVKWWLRLLGIFERRLS